LLKQFLKIKICDGRKFVASCTNR